MRSPQGVAHCRSLTINLADRDVESVDLRPPMTSITCESSSTSEDGRVGLDRTCVSRRALMEIGRGVFAIGAAGHRAAQTSASIIEANFQRTASINLHTEADGSTGSLKVNDFIPTAERAAIRSRTSSYDATEAIMACIIEAASQRKAVGFGGGRYRCLGDIEIPVGDLAAINLHGAGMHQTQIEFSGPGISRGLSMNSGAGFAFAGAISDLSLHATNGAPRALTWSYLTQPVLRNVLVTGVAGCGLYVNNTIMPRLDNVLFLGCGSATEGTIEFDACTTPLLTSVYVSGGLAGGGTGKLGGILFDRTVNVTVVGGAIESTGTPILIASKSEGTQPCDGGVVIATDFENPGNDLPYIDAGSGWTGAASGAAKGWTFISTVGYPSGTTTSVHAVQLENVTGFTFTNCGWNQPGSPTSVYELVGTGNRGVILNPARQLAGNLWPYVRVNGTQDTSATPLVAWNSESKVPINNYKQTSGATPSLILNAQGGVYNQLYLNNGGATDMTNITGGFAGMEITLIDPNGNTTIKHQQGGVGQFTNASGADIVMTAERPYKYYYSPSNDRWTQF